MYAVHPKTIVLLTIGAIFEMWIVFGIVYAAFGRKDGNSYWVRVRHALMLKYH